MSDKIIIAGQLSGFTPRKDHTLSLRFSTQEYDRSQISLDDLKEKFLDKYGILYFRTGDEAIADDLMNDLDSVDIDIYDKAKTPSKRLRNSLYMVWKTTREGQIEFKEYYSMQMEKIIRHYQDQIID